MTDDRRNFVLFAVIAALILFGWPRLQNRFFPTANPPVTRIEKGKEVAVARPGSDPTADTPAAIRDRRLVLADTPRVRIETPTMRGSINLVGPRIDDLILTRYNETVAKGSAPIRLLSPAGAPQAYFAGFGWRGDGLETPAANVVWKASSPVLTPERAVTLDAAGPAGQRFRISIAVDDSFMFTVRQTVLNAGSAPASVVPYGFVNRIGVSKDPDSWQTHTGPVGASEAGANYDITFSNLDGERPGFFARTFGSKSVAGTNNINGREGWIGFTDKYWLTALIPDGRIGLNGQFRLGRGGNSYQADVSAAPRILQANQQFSVQTRFFAGAKEVRLLDRYTDQGIATKLDYAIDWGWFRLLMKPIFYLLDWLFHLVGNYGVAIILLTLIIRLLLYPIAQRQFASMAAVRAVQPKMKALQERYKDDKVRLQQEVMALYKAEKVNPLAGCLPTLIQIPIFYALYKVLMVSIEMRHQPFVGWIRDLSSPDPLTPVNLFGLLAFTPPHFLAIGVVPILLGISMYFQFKLNPQPMDETQAQVFKILPWVLMFVMAPFAVGLQVYWITTNCVTILQQRLLYRRYPVLPAEPAK